MPDPQLTESQVNELRSAIEKLSTEIAQIQQRLAVLETRLAGSAQPAVPSATVYVAPIPGSAPGPVPPREHKLGLTLINRIGAITLALGVIFFFKYAVDNQWIGPAGRVVLGIIAGFALIAAAEWLRRRHAQKPGEQTFMQGLAGCGLATLYISVYAAFAYYGLVALGFAFASLIAVSIIGMILSFRYNHPAIAALGLTGAFLTPPLLSMAGEEMPFLFPYLPFLDVFASEIAIRARWPALNALTLFGTAILFLTWALGRHRSAAAGLFWLSLLFALFLITVLRETRHQTKTVSQTLVPANAFWALLGAWILIGHEHPIGFALYALALSAIHFGARSMASQWHRVHALLYLTGHGCLLVAGVRLVASWAESTASPANRVSVISELDSVFLAIYGVVMIAIAVLRRSAPDRFLGLTLIGIVIGKLYLYDVWQLAHFYRITAFVALGVILLAASFIYSRFRARPGPG
ncbi:MAG: DUF2339 domain-containing protein [Acidobacteriaceae bacterium]|nr:DUF2339 domain-containing protein [Acidobacteriaceae bacterium]